MSDLDSTAETIKKANMEPIRCQGCGKLLARADLKKRTIVEIKCPRCGRMNRMMVY